MSLRRSFAALAAACALPFATPAIAANPWGLAPGDYYSELSGSLYSTYDFWNDDKKRESFGGRLEERVVRSHNEFGWRKWATLTLDVPFVSRSFVPFTSAASTSTGLGDIGMAIRIPIRPIALEFGVSLPAGSNRRLFPGTSGDGGLNGATLLQRNSVPLSDTSTYFSQGLTTGYATLGLGGSAGKHAYWAIAGGFKGKFLSAGKRDSTDRYADFAIADGSLGFWLSNNLLLGGEFRGEWQVSQGAGFDHKLGPNGSAKGPELESVRMIVGPRITYRVDDRMDVFAGSMYTPSGRNVIHHDMYYVGIAWKHTGLDRLAGALGGTKSR